MEAPSSATTGGEALEAYRVALLDWLACAVGGSAQPAARAARAAADGLAGHVTCLSCDGHVLDSDDSYSPGMVQVSATFAPVALLLDGSRCLDTCSSLDVYGTGFETT